MKVLAALLVAVALITPAIAQNDVVKEMQNKQKNATVAPAIKPILLHTGKPITQHDKQQLLATVIKAYAAKAPGVKSKPNSQGATSSAATSAMITPLNMSKSGFVGTFANNVVYLGYSDSGAALALGAGSTSDLSFKITVNPNTAYTLTFNVYGQGEGAGNATFKIVDGHYPEETLAGIKNGSNEFAYAFVSGSYGSAVITVTSSQPWEFTNCEIVANPLN
jgi:hypothetical protein